MSAPTSIATEHLIEYLRLLCAQPSSSGREHELELTAELVVHLMQRSGLQARLVSTPGAPVVIGQRTGKQPFTLLLYHHYDSAPIGPWREWHHDPYTLAERDESLYGRGMALGKGPLAAHLSGLAALLAAEQELPCGVVVVAEGEGLTGSAQLADALASLDVPLCVNACLAINGDRNAQGQPYCYSGSKGLMRVRLSVDGANQPLAPGLAEVVANPLWRLVWALANIKSEDEDIKIDGFYDDVDGPSRETNRAVRKLALDEAGRLAAWGLPQFLFGMSGGALTSAETTLPTCNLSEFSAEPVSSIGNIPTHASAVLDFQLVPQQQPEAISRLLKEHLNAHGFADVRCELLPGSYAAVFNPLETPFVQQVANIGTQIYGAPLSLLPMGPFAAPLQLFQKSAPLPVATIGCLRPDSGARTVNEHVPLADFVSHSQMLMELMGQLENSGN